MPDWYLILEACTLIREKPHDIDPEGRTLVFWREAALTKLGCERWAEKKQNERFSEEMKARREGRGRSRKGRS